MLSLEFGWTPAEICELTLFDFDDYLAAVEALNEARKG
jgi:hypothetical protein